ncbi:MAG: NFACT family protein [Desulfurococcales archaeon]|nr:NFACT family protein [Desulfurococcales archaeon]
MESFRKKSLTALDVAVLVKELRKVLIDCLVTNLYNVGERGYLLKLKSFEGDTLYLVIEPAIRLHLTKYIPPLGISGRTPLFRRFLKSSRIRSLSQHEFERIVVVGVTRGGEDFSVIIELIPRGIVAVLDSQRKVLVSSEDVKLRDRKVYPGIKYEFPPLFPNPRSIGAEEWLELIKDARNLGTALIRKLGIPPEVVNEVLSESERKLKPSMLSLNQVSNVRERILEFIESVIERPSPVIVVCRGEYSSFHPFKPANLPAECSTLEFSSFNEVVDEYFRALYASALKEAEEKGLASESAKLKAVISKAIQDLEKLKDERSRIERLLRVIEGKYDVLESVWRCVRDVVKTSGWDQVRNACKQIVEVDPTKGSFTVKVNDEYVSLKITEKMHEQYINLRRRYSHLSDKIAQAEKRIKELESRLKSISSTLTAKKEIKPLLKKVEWYSSYHWIITSSGFLAIGGKDAQQNEKVVKKYLSENDIFIHAEVHGASAFVLKCSGAKPPEKDIYEVSVLAASYSRGWKVGVGSLDVFWVWGKQVSKAPPPGQYLPKGAFMIYGKRNYVKGVPLRLAIGVQIRNDKYYELIVGPEELVKKRAAKYAVLIPGTTSQRSVAVKIKEAFTANDSRLLTLTVDDIIEHIPGPSTIVKVVK